jgi:hypothetical protein
VTGWKKKYITLKTGLLTPTEVKLYLKHKTEMWFEVFTALDFNHQLQRPPMP